MTCCARGVSLFLWRHHPALFRCRDHRRCRCTTHTRTQHVRQNYSFISFPLESTFFFFFFLTAAPSFVSSIFSPFFFSFFKKQKLVSLTLEWFWNLRNWLFDWHRCFPRFWDSLISSILFEEICSNGFRLGLGWVSLAKRWLHLFVSKWNLEFCHEIPKLDTKIHLSDNLPVRLPIAIFQTILWFHL